MRPLCALYVPSLRPLCALYVPSLCPLCALYAPPMRQLCSLYEPSMRPLCALYAPSLRPLCALYAPSMRPLCALYAPSMRPLCALYSQEFKKDKSLHAEFIRTGKTIPADKIEKYDKEEEKKAEEVRNVRINYIKMRNKMKKLGQLLKEKEKLTDGLHLIDFEQLKIENTTLNEKIEERNEDLLKLRKKVCGLRWQTQARHGPGTRPPNDTLRVWRNSC